jgi:exonuclease SbcD
MFKFLHAADIHLDSPLRGLERYEGAPVEEIRGATRRALANLTELAVAERVAFVLIAGDLYDGDWHDYGTGLFLHAQMVKLRESGIEVFLIRGNHDAANLMTRELRLPDRVHVLSDAKPQTIAVDGCGVLIHGQGFATRDMRENLATAYPDGQAGYFNIGILHTCATGRDGHESYAPCSIDDMRSKRYDYWALGHIHKREVLHDDPLIVFPGNIQGRHMRETGGRGCMLVTVDRGRVVAAEHRALDVMRWETCRVRAEGAATEDDVLQCVSDRIRELMLAADDRPLAVRVEIAGPCPAHDRVMAQAEGFTAQVRAQMREVGAGRVWVEKVQLKTVPARALESSDGPIGVLMQYLDELRADEQKLARLGEELVDLKKKLPIELRSGEDAIDLDSAGRLRELLDGVGPMIVRGILAQEGGL